MRHLNPRIAADLSDIRSDMNRSLRIYIHIDSGLLVASVDVVEIPDAIPVRSELLGLLRIDPAVVRLVVRIRGSHKLHIRAV